VDAFVPDLNFTSCEPTRVHGQALAGGAITRASSSTRTSATETIRLVPRAHAPMSTMTGLLLPEHRTSGTARCAGASLCTRFVDALALLSVLAQRYVASAIVRFSGRRCPRSRRAPRSSPRPTTCTALRLGGRTQVPLFGDSASREGVPVPGRTHLDDIQPPSGYLRHDSSFHGRSLGRLGVSRLRPRTGSALTVRWGSVYQYCGLSPAGDGDRGFTPATATPASREPQRSVTGLRRRAVSFYRPRHRRAAAGPELYSLGRGTR